MAEKKPFLLRIEPALWREIERWAADDLRSANAQVEWILRQALVAHKRKAPEEGAKGKGG